MSILTASPSPILSQYIKSFWAIQNHIQKGSEYTYRIVPNGLMELMVYLDDRPVSLSLDKNLLENTILSGHHKEYYDLQISKKLSLFSVVFQPYGAMLFFDIPLNKINNLNVPLKYILKKNVLELETKLFETKSFKEKIVIVEQYLIKLLQKNRKKYEFNRIKHSISLINQKKAIINVNQLASEACLSRKQFERTFLEYIGATPKQFLKAVRFQNVLLEKSLNKNDNLTKLAYNCGYYDQSHMNGDFNSLTGMPPKHYFTECEPFSDYFE